jgi:hypothetical protein
MIDCNPGGNLASMSETLLKPELLPILYGSKLLRIKRPLVWPQQTTGKLTIIAPAIAFEVGGAENGLLESILGPKALNADPEAIVRVVAHGAFRIQHLGPLHTQVCLVLGQELCAEVTQPIDIGANRYLYVTQGLTEMLADPEQKKLAWKTMLQFKSLVQ